MARKTAKDTEELEHEIRQAARIEDYLEENAEELNELTFPAYLAQLLREKGLSRVEAIARSGLEKVYAYHILAGRKRPARDKVLMLALGLGLSVRETQRLLYLTKHERLYARDNRDSIILFALSKGMTVLDANLLLASLGETPLA